ncbi:MAG: hypothetical protein WBW41_07190 [Verrucomicrobiia bacterium]
MIFRVIFFCCGIVGCDETATGAGFPGGIAGASGTETGGSGGAEAGETAMGDGIPGGIADTGETEGVTQFSVPGFTGAVSGGFSFRKSEFTSAHPTKASAPMPKIGISFFTGDMQPKTFAGRKSSRIEGQKRETGH